MPKIVRSDVIGVGAACQLRADSFDALSCTSAKKKKNLGNGDL
ncbi:hypothetical protein [Candidatus Electronema sp. JC]